MAQQIKITQTSNADMNIGVPKNLTMAQQTAVEWLVDKWSAQGTIYSSDIHQAKAMEKEQIIKAVRAGHQFCEDGFVPWMGEQYYNETYESK
jgi:hypothetical protein